MLAFATIAWTSLPYLVGYTRSSPELHFSGSFIYPQDGNSYLAKMRQGAQGAWLIHLPYTSEAHAPAPVLMLYPLLGKLAVFTGLSFEATYQLARLAGGLALLAALGLFLRAFVPHRAWWHLAFALIVVSGGLGWLLSALFPKYIPLELLAPHLYIFAMLYSPPHMSLGVAVLLLMFVGLRGLMEALTPGPSPVAAGEGGSGRVSFPFPQRGRGVAGEHSVRGEGWVVGLLGVALAFIRPETVPIFWGVLTIYLIALVGARQVAPLRSAIRRLLPAAIGLPVLAAVYATVMRNPAFRAWMAQNPFPAPSPLDLALGLAPLLPFGLLALRGRRWWRGPGLFVTVWALTTPVLAYLPFGSQSRLLSGIVIPWGILASEGWLRVIRPALRRGWRRWATMLWVGVAALSAIWFILMAAVYVSTRPADLFYPPAAREMAAWLTAHAPDRPVLSAWQTGNLLAAQGAVRVFLGHPIETLDYAAKATDVQHFFQATTTAEERRSLLRRYGIGYVAYGPWERKLGAFDPVNAPELRRVFALGEYALYKVVSP
ncbi:MAG: hypothetical protein C4311_08395 [Chloroflexota bacterium]